MKRHTTLSRLPYAPRLVVLVKAPAAEMEALRANISTFRLGMPVTVVTPEGVLADDMAGWVAAEHRAEVVANRQQAQARSSGGSSEAWVRSQWVKRVVTGFTHLNGPHSIGIMLDPATLEVPDDFLSQVSQRVKRGAQVFAPIMQFMTPADAAVLMEAHSQDKRDQAHAFHLRQQGQRRSAHRRESSNQELRLAPDSGDNEAMGVDEGHGRTGPSVDSSTADSGPQRAPTRLLAARLAQQEDRRLAPFLTTLAASKSDIARMVFALSAIIDEGEESVRDTGDASPRVASVDCAALHLLHSAREIGLKVARAPT